MEPVSSLSQGFEGLSVLVPSPHVTKLRTKEAITITAIMPKTICCPRTERAFCLETVFFFFFFFFAMI